jgi:hypothetical protein
MDTDIFENPLLYAVLAIFLGVYGPRLHPKLPKSVRRLFNSTWFRVLIILLIAFVSSHDLKLSLLIALVFMLVMVMVDGEDIREHFQSCKSCS